MAIFTSVANYLKCRNYFESVLGFKLVDKYPDESIEDYNSDIDGFETTEGDSLHPSVPDIDACGIFCRKSNRIIAHNIWFLYGKAQPWDTGDDNPPREIKEGFVIKDANGNITTDNNGDKFSGFVLDPAGSNSGLEFIGMKRLLPLDDTIVDPNTGKVDLDKPSKVSAYKDFVQFIKLKDGASPEKLINYNQEIKPKNSGADGLNEQQPNSLLLRTAYDYSDFEFDTSGKEYNIRQLGMMINLHVTPNVQAFIKDKQTLYNGMENGTNIVYLCDLFNITENSIEVPIDLLLGDRFTSIVGGNYTYDSVTDNWLIKELDLGDGNVTPNGSDVAYGVRTNYAVQADNTFFGILQFYINTMPNNRITFQTDTYNFILSFENQIKCSCTCSNCECPKI